MRVPRGQVRSGATASKRIALIGRDLCSPGQTRSLLIAVSGDGPHGGAALRLVSSYGTKPARGCVGGGEPRVFPSPFVEKATIFTN